MDQKERHLFRPEYRWPADKFSAPFFTFPAWWRRFLFQVLSTRDITVYHYYLSVMNTVGLAWPSVRQVASDFGVRDPETIRTSLRRLVDYGFLLQPDDDDRIVYKIGDRPLYQRPCVQYTIQRLLECGQIDGELYPMSNRQRTEHDKASDSVVMTGIKTMLGDLFPAYEQALNFERPDREEVLIDALKSMLQVRLDEMAAKVTAQVASKPVDASVFENIPDSVKLALRLSDLSTDTLKTKPKKAGSSTGQRRAKKSSA